MCQEQQQLHMSLLDSHFSLDFSLRTKPCSWGCDWLTIITIIITVFPAATTNSTNICSGTKDHIFSSYIMNITFLVITIIYLLRFCFNPSVGHPSTSSVF
ncbi:hypothetical protein FKM82_028842 [Ascaphus truei]